VYSSAEGFPLWCCFSNLSTCEWEGYRL